MKMLHILIVEVVTGLFICQNSWNCPLKGVNFAVQKLYLNKPGLTTWDIVIFIYLYCTVSFLQETSQGTIKDGVAPGDPNMPCFYPTTSPIQQILERNHDFVIPAHPPPEGQPLSTRRVWVGGTEGAGELGVELPKGPSPAKNWYQINVCWMNRRTGACDTTLGVKGVKCMVMEDLTLGGMHRMQHTDHVS